MLVVTASVFQYIPRPRSSAGYIILERNLDSSSSTLSPPLAARWSAVPADLQSIVPRGARVALVRELVRCVCVFAHARSLPVVASSAPATDNAPSGLSTGITDTAISASHRKGTQKWLRFLHFLSLS